MRKFFYIYGETVMWTIWFKRNEWHGIKGGALGLLGDFAIYHSHTSDLTNIGRSITKAAERARRAYAEYPDCPPYQDIDGNLVAQEPMR